MHLLLVATVYGAVSVTARSALPTIPSLRRHFGYNSPADGSVTLDVSFGTNGHDYSVMMNGNEWLLSGLTSFISNSEWASVTVNRTESQSGYDNFGDFDEMTLFWQDAENAQASFATAFRTYPANPDVIVLTQGYPNGASNMAANDKDGIVSSFPSFEIKESSNKSLELAFVHFSGFMASANYPQYGLWRADNSSASQLSGGNENSGPLCIYDTDFSNGLVISPLTNHMGASDNMASFDGGHEYRCGIIGNVSSVPAGFKMSWILSAARSGGGVNKAMRDWGDKMLLYYGKKRGNAHARDYTLNYLGYSTDNGAYYYYETEPNKNYQQTILDLKTYWDKMNLPVKYILLDSWWYYQGVDSGVKKWSPKPSVFPDGLPYLHNVTNLAIQAHNRYWSLDNVYASNNPPPYNNETNKSSSLFPFTFSSGDGLPLTRQFWDYLFAINNNWGLTVYEQDWLSKSSTDIPMLVNNVTFGRDWLRDMGMAALDAGISVQYCMSYPRHVMTSVELQSVTQARASNDYHPGNDQWIIGTSSLFTSSIDIMPSKDSYWTQDNPQAGHYTNGTNEPYNRLQSCVLSFSNGPVTFSDRIGYSNASLIMRACNQDGLLLRPETSATAIDRYFLYQALESINKTRAYAAGVAGEIWSSSSQIGSYARYLYVFGASVAQTTDVTVQDLGYHFDSDESMASNYLAFETNTTSSYSIVNASVGLEINECEQYDFQLYTLIPMTYGIGEDVWYLQGEIDKWVSVSKQRFESIVSVESGSIQVTINGAVGETVNVAFVNGKSLQQVIVECTISETQSAIVRMPDQSCQNY